jgi:arylformamidase
MALDYEKLYNPRTTIPDFADYFARWTASSAHARASERCYLDVPYGPSAAETMDIFQPRGASRGLLVFIHGGYWRMLDKKDQSFIAPAFTAAGVTVAIPNYALCPTVTIDELVRQVLQATAWAYRNGVNFGAPAGNLYVAGHSAGGHLTAMMLAARWPVFAADLPKKVVRGGLSLSGLYDLRPIMKVASVNTSVRLTSALVDRVSPAFMPPATDAPLHTAVGEHENRGFHDQNKIIAAAWKSVHRSDIACPGLHHFSILDEFGRSGSTLHRATLGMMGLT